MPFEKRNFCSIKDCHERCAINLLLFGNRRCVCDEYFCEGHAKDFILTRWSAPDTPCHLPFVAGATPFDIDIIPFHLLGGPQLVYLRELGGTRTVPFYMGPCEAAAIAYSLTTDKDTHLSHHVMLALLTELGGELLHALVSNLKVTSARSYYQACLRLTNDDHSSSPVSVSARPSDAFALAIVSNKPIFISNDILQQPGVVIDNAR